MANSISVEMINQTTVFVTKDFTPLIADRILVYYLYGVYSILCPGVNLFGIVSNIINIICFVKQGFKESINISLTGLAISDLGCLVTSCLINIMFTPAINEADLPLDLREVSFPVASMPHLIFTRVTSWITAIITLERCLCVLVPLKVKQVITPRRMLFIIASVFIILILCGSPIYFVRTLGVKFYSSKNKTLLGLLTVKDGAYYCMIYFTLNSFFLPFVAFIMISVCTAILVYNLHQKTKWRTVSTTASAAGASIRSNKAAKMVVMISTLYISCTVPVTATLLALAMEPGLNVGGRYVNIGLVCAGIGILMESINSSSNICIYYNMSSKYKQRFLHLFGIVRKLKKM